MKLKRSKYISLFFLISFFASSLLNICLASNFNSYDHTNNQFKKQLHITQNTGSVVVNDLLFEENENEDEQECSAVIVLLPTFLRDFQNETNLFSVSPFVTFVTKPTRPIYIQVNNFRI